MDNNNNKPMNTIIILSDEHQRGMAGCYGHPKVKTPNLDKLAENGVRFSNAYTNCPLCVPARGSLATGRYVHEIGTWDNASPYCGQVPSWGHRLINKGHNVTSIGKLHYRSDEDDNGFTESRLALHCPYDGLGDLAGLVKRVLKDDESIRKDEALSDRYCRETVLAAGPGESSYIRYDLEVAEEAQRFIKEEASSFDKPFALLIGFVSPHFPLIVPQQYFDMYPLEDIEIPVQYPLAKRPMHPVIQDLRSYLEVADELDELTVRRAIAAYYGLCTFLDDQIGKVLKALEETGLNENTRIIYTSDHGDMVGEKGCWLKHTMYEQSVGIPFIMSGPDLPKGKVVDTNVTLVDCYPTIIESVGVAMDEDDKDLPGTSLLPYAKGDSLPQRIAFSEYNAPGTDYGVFMIRNDRYKYVYYVNYQPQLFDLIEDPNELNDLAVDPEYKSVLEELEKELRKICDPETVDFFAQRDQKRRFIELGGRKIINKCAQFPFSPPPKKYCENNSKTE